MNFKILLAFLFLVSVSKGLAQGLLIDENLYEKLPSFDRLKIEKALLNVPISFDLRPFMPEILNQGLSNSCVAIATNYYLVGARRAFLMGSKSKAYNSKSLALSPMYNWLLNGFKCEDQSGVDISYFASELKSKGGIKFSSFPFLDCKHTTPNTAEIFRIEATYKLCGNGLLEIPCQYNSKIIANLKSLISMGFPILIGVPLGNLKGYDFQNSFYYQPIIEKYPNNYHALTLVAYDANGFTVANTWGQNWGMNGYFKISYTDMQKILVAAITVDITNPNLKSLDIPGDLTSTQLQVQKFKGYSNNGSADFQNMELERTNSNEFKIRNNDLGLFETFRIQIGPYFDTAFVSAFSFNLSSKNLKRHSTDIVKFESDNTKHLLIPGQKKVLEKLEENEVIILLFGGNISAEFEANFNDVLKRMNSSLDFSSEVELYLRTFESSSGVDLKHVILWL